MGCGTLRRPDGYIDLHVKTKSDVLLVLENDEHHHRANSIECELKRIQDMQDRHGGAVYLVRYNCDQPDGLGEAKLQALAERCVAILDGGYVDALKAFGGVLVEYHGYPGRRVEAITLAMLKSQTALGQVEGRGKT